MKIHLLIDNERYPMTIRREDEQLYRDAAKQIDNKLNKYRSYYPDFSPARHWAMAALELAFENISMKDRNDTAPYQEKLQEKILQDSELEALKQFIDDGNADKANEILDYQTVENAIESLLPGKEWGDYLKSHFKPFLNVRLKTLEQKQALRNILEYCDETTLKVPFIMGIGVKIAGGIAPETRTADEMIAYYRDMSESEYEKLKEMVKKGAKMKTGIMKYHPSFIAQRKMQKEFQDKGYNDIFIPNLMVLSPQYAEYKKALDKVNDRMCRELGLHYDSNYNLVIKNLE